MFLVISALIIFGPERLPGALLSLTRFVRQAQQYAIAGQQRLAGEFASEIEDLKAPLSDLAQLRKSTPQQSPLEYLFNGEDQASRRAVLEPSTAVGVDTVDASAAQLNRSVAVPTQK